MKLEKLTESEEIIMKSVWDFKKEPMLSDVVERSVGFYGKDWKPQTVSTFLSKLCRKNYLNLQRNGKIYTYKVMVKEADYRRKLYRQHISFWHGNDPVKFIQEMIDNGDVDKEKLKEIL